MRNCVYVVCRFLASLLPFKTNELPKSVSKFVCHLDFITLSKIIQWSTHSVSHSPFAIVIDTSIFTIVRTPRQRVLYDRHLGGWVFFFFFLLWWIFCCCPLLSPLNLFANVEATKTIRNKYKVGSQVPIYRKRPAKNSSANPYRNFCSCTRSNRACRRMCDVWRACFWCK